MSNMNEMLHRDTETIVYVHFSFSLISPNS